MAIFDKKPLLIDGRIIFSPKDLSSGEKFALLFSTTTTKDDNVKNKVIPITTIRKQPHDDEEKE